MVKGIITVGERALRHPIEGAEDSKTRSSGGLQTIQLFLKRCVGWVLLRWPNTLCNRCIGILRESLGSVTVSDCKVIRYSASGKHCGYCH